MDLSAPGVFSNLLDTVVEAAPQSIVASNMAGTITLFNEASEKMFGYSRSEVIGERSLSDLHPWETRDIISAIVTGKESLRLFDHETEAVHKSGFRIPVRLTCEPLFKDGVRVGTITYFLDDTERRATEERLRIMSITDEATNLYNRKHFLSLAEKEHDRAMRTKSPFSVLMMDIDHFADFNGTYGRAEGERALATLAEIARRTFRAMDTVFRYSGREYAVLLPETDCVHAMFAAERYRIRVVETDFVPTVAEKKIPLTVSVGLAEHRDGRSIEDIVRFAALAMQAAKSCGRNQSESYEHLATRILGDNPIPD